VAKRVLPIVLVLVVLAVLVLMHLIDGAFTSF